MGFFTEELKKTQPKTESRRWLFVPYDQLSDQMGPLSRERPADLGIILLESLWKADRRPYHKQKLALVVANLRHFALEQARRGVAVRHLICQGPYHQALEPLVAELGAIQVMIPAERELRSDLDKLAGGGKLVYLPHEGWLTQTRQFEMGSGKTPPWRMDAFYREVRRDTGILMDQGKPVGGKFSMDTENRLAWRGKPPAPNPPTFPIDPIKEEVGDLIQREFVRHPGHLDIDALPATRSDSERLWSWAKTECLHRFGPYEDAMSLQSRGLFHTRISSLVNLHRLLPSKVLSEVIELDIPLSSKEGFIRQVLGWREFVRHVHLATDGFRDLPAGLCPVQLAPGDGGYNRWSGKHWGPAGASKDPDGGAAPSHLGGETPLPPAYWGEPSGMTCLDHVVATVWEEGYSHHITRLMILSNLATLLDVRPRELTDWFWVAYIDAYDWVVEPNVLGMGTFALGDLMMTKPYVSGAAYINRMSDYCRACAFHPKTNCPVTPLYWAFLARHRDKLQSNPRLQMPMTSLGKRTASQKRTDQQVFRTLRDTLMKGEVITPKSFNL